MAERKRDPLCASPKGVAKYPHLNVPQTTVGDKPCDPTYSLGLLLDPNEASTKAFKAKIEKDHADGFAAAKKADPKKKYTDMGLSNVFKDDTNKDGEPTGKLEVRFKCKAEGKRKDGSIWKFKPALFRSTGAVIPSDVTVFGGSVMQVSYAIRHTAMPTGAFYTKLELKAVQVYVLVDSYQRDAGAYGFTTTDEDETNAFGEPAENGEAGAEADTDF